MAAGFNHTEIVKLLAARMENPNEPRIGDGVTPLLLAAQEGYIKIVKFLASVVENPNIPDQFGYTPVF